MTSAPPAVRIVVADDHQVVRTGFAALLDTQPDFAVVGTACDGTEAVRICRELSPRRGLDGRAHARHGRHRGHQAARRIRAGREPGPADPDPDDLRPGPLRVRRAVRRGQWLPASRT